MNENLDLVEILKDCPKGTKLWSSIFGDVRLDNVYQDEEDYTISITDKYKKERTFTSKGYYLDKYDGECVLFPSKDQRDWSKFKAPVKKFDPKTLNPFDKVLAKICDGDAYCWYADFVSMPATAYDRIPCIMSNKDCDMIIPYNDDTKHLLGTCDMPDEKYIWWEN